MSFPFIGTVLGQEVVSLYRDTVGQVIGADRRPVTAARTLVTAIMQASIQPLGGRQFLQLGLSGRQQDYVRIYSETEMQAGDNQAALKPRGDTVVKADGTTYEVVTVLDYANGPYPHWKGIGRRLDESHTDGGA